MSPADVVLERGGVWSVARAARAAGCGVRRARAILQREEREGRIHRVPGAGGGWSADRVPTWRPACDLAVEVVTDAIDRLTRDGKLATWAQIAHEVGQDLTAIRGAMAWLRGAGMIQTHLGRGGGVELA